LSSCPNNSIYNGRHIVPDIHCSRTSPNKRWGQQSRENRAKHNNQEQHQYLHVNDWRNFHSWL